MSEVQSRPPAPRGRGFGRGGRGGYSTRGRGGSRQTKSDKADAPSAASYADEGEIGHLKKQYSSSLGLVKDMFPSYTDEDIVFALEENGGNLEQTIDKMAEGNISKWGEVKKKTKTSKTTKEPIQPDAATTSLRSGRGRGGLEGQRGSRGGRGTERSRGNARGSRGGSTLNGRSSAVVDKGTEPSGIEISAPADSTSTLENVTEHVDQWVDTNQGDTTSPDASWEMVTPSEAAPPPVAEAQKLSLRPDGTRSWASMLKPVAKPKIVPANPATAPAAPAQEAVSMAPEANVPPEQPTNPVEESLLSIQKEAAEELTTPSAPPSLPPPDSAITIVPSNDKLTEENLEQVKDVSEPVATDTVASTVGTDDLRSMAGNLTPVPSTQQLVGGIRPGLGGFATSAQKATTGSGRTSSVQRRAKEQQEAVVMPENHAVDRTAVQFGSLGLNRNPEDLDLDDDREDAETRTQPPQHSPIVPRASLPPSALQATETVATPRQAPGFPAAAPQPVQPSQVDAQQSSQTPYNQFNNRYGLPVTQGEGASAANKAYDPFGQQLQQNTNQAHPLDGYPSQTPTLGQQAQGPQSHLGGFSSATSDYSSYYTSDSQRNAFQNFYGAYAQQGQQAPQDALTSQQRIGAGFGSSGADQPSQYATSQGHSGPQGRFAGITDAQNSGQSTPNTLVNQAAHTQSQAQTHQTGQGQAQTSGQPGGYYGNPYYNSPYYQAYVTQGTQHAYGRERPMFDDARRYDDSYLSHNHHYGYGGQGSYGSGPYGSKYAQPHQNYGMSPQNSYDTHGASPANAGGYGHQVPGRDNGSAAFGGYGRTASTQPVDSQAQPVGSSGAFGGMSDVFGRSPSGYPTQSSQQQMPQTGNDDASRGFGDTSKIPGGPSPAPGQAGGRPGSAANSLPGQTSGPGSQGQGQQGYVGYPSHQMHSGQHTGYGGLGGLGGQHHSGGQSHQTAGYGGYGAGFGGSYYGNNNRGGWGGNYGH